jgi:nucleoside 2-deoxyribosyltransferase
LKGNHVGDERQFSHLWARPNQPLIDREVYLAGPFFNMPQRWLIEEARRCLSQVGLKVFSPFHDIGPGPAEYIGPKDIEALQRCDVVFAIVDRTDTGTIFEIGYARALGKPVYAFAQTTSEEDLKMIAGTDCRIYGDFVTAIHHAAWRA